MTKEELLAKAKKFALILGESGLEKVFLAYHVLSDPDIPGWARTKLLGALAYFLLPVDAIPDALVGIGLTDDIAILAAALLSVSACVREKHYGKAKASVDGLLGRSGSN